MNLVMLDNLRSPPGVAADYKQRFRAAMQHYFTVVPTKASMWMMLFGNYQTLVDPALKQVRCLAPKPLGFLVR